MKIFNPLLCFQKGINSIPVRPRQKKTFSPSHFSFNCWQLKWCWQNSFAFKPLHSRTGRLMPKSLHQLFFFASGRRAVFTTVWSACLRHCALGLMLKTCHVGLHSVLHSGVYTLSLSSLKVSRTGVLCGFCSPSWRWVKKWVSEQSV